MILINRTTSTWSLDCAPRRDFFMLSSASLGPQIPLGDMNEREALRAPQAKQISADSSGFECFFEQLESATPSSLQDSWHHLPAVPLNGYSLLTCVCASRFYICDEHLVQSIISVTSIHSPIELCILFPSTVQSHSFVSFVLLGARNDIMGKLLGFVLLFLSFSPISILGQAPPQVCFEV